MKTSEKAASAYYVPPKLLKIALKVIDCHSTNIMNEDFTNKKYAEKTKVIIIRLIARLK